MVGIASFCQSFVRSIAIRSSTAPTAPVSNLFSRFGGASMPRTMPILPVVLGGFQVREMRHGMRRGRLGRDPKRRFVPSACLFADVIFCISSLSNRNLDRWALLRNQVTDLIKHERIQTTVAKAKEASPPLPERYRTTSSNRHYAR